MTRSISLFAVIFVLASCSRQTTLNPGETSAPANPAPPKGIPVTGRYCTVWTQYLFTGGNVPINLSCVQPDGSWMSQNGFPEAPLANGLSNRYGGASLARAQNGDLLLSYLRWNADPVGEDLIASRYNPSAGWSLISSTPVNGAANSPYSQFGGRVFDFLGAPRVLWTTTSQGFLSSWSQNSWAQLGVATSQGNFFRHPEVVVSATGTVAYLHYGEPSPSVWQYDGTQLTSLGGPSINSASESSLYTSLTEWNGQLVLAYTSSNFLLNQNWNVQTDTTKIALWNGSTWSLISTGIQDTPGHDGVNPFVFTSNGNLYVLYSDYSTTGLPANSQQISFRFRVKQWNGSIWTQVGSESDVINLSQRFEFLNDNGTVLVHVFQPDPAGTGSREAVLSWSNGVFGYLGKAIRTFPQAAFSGSARPGAVVRFQ